MQSNTYLKYAGIKGEATAKGYEDLIPVLSVDWGVGREITAYTGTSHDREASSARLYDVTITKLQDSSSTDLLKEATIGKGELAEIHVTKQTQGKEKIDEVIKIDLRDALISNYSMSIHDDRPVETLTISYTDIQLKVVAYEDDNLTNSNKVVGYDGKTGIGR